MTTIGERIKKVRQEKHLTQQKFGEQIGLKQNSIAIIESGKRDTSDQTLMAICREFHVNETWLRTGEGEMYAPEKEELLLNDPSLDDADRALLNSYIEAPPALRKQIRELLCRMADRMRESQQAAPAPPADAPPVSESDTLADEPALEDLTDEEKEILRQLRLEKSTKTSAASPSIA